MARGTLKNIFNLIDAAKNENTIADQFLSDLKTAIERGAERDKRSPSLSYKPSSMVCPRNMYFTVTGALQDEEGAGYQLIGMGESGSARHSAIQRAVVSMKDFGIDCEYINVQTYIEEKQANGELLELLVVEQQEYETKLYHKGLNISFLCDGIVLYKGEYYILEIKTEISFKWQSRTDVADEHHPQATAYSICLGLDKVIFVYENRDTCDKKAYTLEVTSDMKYDLVFSKIEEAEEHIALGFPPPIPADLPKKVCRYCPYKKICGRGDVQ